jgi:hypothetical protein
MRNPSIPHIPTKRYSWKCRKTKEKRDEVGLVVRDITKSKTKRFKVTVKTKQQYKY